MAVDREPDNHSVELGDIAVGQGRAFPALRWLGPEGLGWAVVLDMSTAEGGYDERPLVGSCALPQEIRAGLLPEETTAFDMARRAALDEAADELDMTRAFETLAHWQRIARSNRLAPCPGPAEAELGLSG